VGEATAVVAVVIASALAAFHALAHDGNRVVIEFVGVAGTREVMERGDAGVIH
jgi:hypothetical protein